MQIHGVWSKQVARNVYSRGGWKDYLTVPSGWSVAYTSIEKLAQQKRTPPVTVFWETKWNPTRGQYFANAIADVLRVSQGDGFVLFSFEEKEKVDIKEIKELLMNFPCPERVELAFSRKGIADTLQEVLAKWEVLQQKAQSQPRASALDGIKEVLGATQDLREEGGNLSAKKVAKLFGLSLRAIAQLMARTPQALSKTPTADSMQNELGYFERIARLRLVLKNDAAFRKWLRMGNTALGGKKPMEFLQERKWQALADFVDDILTGTPT